MIESAVGSTLMRLPVAELSSLRKIFLDSPGGLSLEGFVAAMIPPATAGSGGTLETIAHRRRRSEVRVLGVNACGGGMKQKRKGRVAPPRKIQRFLEWLSVAS